MTTPQISVLFLLAVIWIFTFNIFVCALIGSISRSNIRMRKTIHNPLELRADGAN